MKLPPQMKAIPPPRIGTPTSPPPPAAQPAQNLNLSLNDAQMQNGGGNNNDDAALPPPPMESQTHLGNTVDATPPKSRAQTVNGKAANGLALHNGGATAAATAVAGVVIDDDDDLPPPPPAITDESNYAVTEL